MKKIATIILVTVLTASLLTGCQNSTPFIGENGNWWTGETDTGVVAQGPQGEQGPRGEQGQQGAQGDTGATITVKSVEKTKSVGAVDTYTITFSDNSTATFTVTNGTDGENIYISSVEKTSSAGSVDTYTITFSDKSTHTFTVTNGSNGTCVTIASIAKSSTVGSVDTYTVTLSDGNKSYFSVTNGVDGETPYIGENGNWWIGENDTGVLADASKADSRVATVTSPFIMLRYMPITINGYTGLIVADYELMMDTDEYYMYEDMLSYDDYIEIGDAVESHQAFIDIIIPNYVGSTPVIGIAQDVFDNDEYIGTVSLSSNTVYLAPYCFDYCSNLTEIDFNGCPLELISAYSFRNTNLQQVELPETVTTIGAYAFANTKLTSIVLPETVTKLSDYCFANVSFQNINYENVKYFGKAALSGYYGGCVYLTKDVEFVDNDAFASAFVYLEHETYPVTWGKEIAGYDDHNGLVQVNCKKNNEYIYSSNGTSVTVFYYIGNEKRVEIPSKIDNLPVTKIGYGFGSISYNAIDVMGDLGLFDDDKPSTWYLLEKLYEVKIPSTVTKIDYGTFKSLGTMIFIPESVNTMSVDAGWLDDGQYFSTSYLAFEGTTYPSFKEGLIDSSASYASERWLSEYGSFLRIGMGIDPSKVVEDKANRTYYYYDINGYSLLAVMHADKAKLTIESSYNNKTVHTIRPHAVSGLWVHTIEIKNGVKKIQGYAFENMNDDSIYGIFIPKSVDTINAYGFNLDDDIDYYVATTTKPAEWDSYWAGRNTGSVDVTYSAKSTDLPKLTDDGYFTYALNGDGTIRITGYYGTIYGDYVVNIPRAVDGKTVTTISANLISQSSGSQYTIYIPEEISTIESRAFVNNGSYYNNYTMIVCFEASGVPTNTASDFYYNSYYGDTTSYVTITYNYELDY